MRIPVVKSDDTVPIPPAVDISDINNDDNDVDMLADTKITTISQTLGT